MLKHIAALHSFLLLNSIPLDRYTIFISRWTSEFIFWLFWKMSLSIHTEVFVWTYVFNSPGYTPRSGIAELYDDSMFTF